MLYCKGNTWNSTKPVCKESDMMSSYSGVSSFQLNVHQSFQDAVVLKTQQQPHCGTFNNIVSREANFRFGLWSHTPSQMSNGEEITKTDPKVQLQQNIQFPSFKVNDGLQTTQEARLQEANEKPGTERHGSEPNDSSGKAGKVDMFTHMFASKAHLSTTTSSALSLVSGTEPSTSSPTSVSAAHTPDVNVLLAPTSPLHHTKTDLPLPETDKVEEKQAETGLQQPPLFQTWSVVPTFSAPTSQSSTETRLSHVTPLSETSKTTKQRSHLAGFHNITMNTTSKAHTLSISLSRRLVCPYPPLPAHGTFYFRNVENPGPREDRHYIQYACYPGYTLAHGDIHSYCQQGGTWSGITPVCLNLTPCSVNNGGCSQLCAHSHYYNQISNQSETRTLCHCTAGFILLDDGHTCWDIDECAINQGLGPCMELCHNSPGSYRCSCSYGHTLAGDGHSCIAECPPGYKKQPAAPPENSASQFVKECLEIKECSRKNGGCSQLCVNQKGGYKCACPASYRLSLYSWKKCLPRATANTAG